jgi:hypothetical protein
MRRPLLAAAVLALLTMAPNLAAQLRGPHLQISEMGPAGDASYAAYSCMAADSVAVV